MGLETLEPIINLLPEVESPKKVPNLKEKLMWTGLVLLIFAVMSVIPPIGIAPGEISGFLQNLQLLTGSRIGTLASLGIGPIVMASIILQLLVGAELIKVDMTNPRDRKLFMGTQKILAYVFVFVEAAIYVLSGFVPAIGLGNQILVIAQLALGGIAIIFLDEVVSKYGIGSGVGLFIASSVSFTIFWRAFSIAQQGGAYVGLVPRLLQGLVNGEIIGSALFPIIATIVVFLIVVYMESMKVEIPLAFGHVRGFGARWPIKFLYVSNIPVILTVALFANIQLWGVFFQNIGFPILGTFVENRPVSGIAYYLRSPYGALGSPESITTTLTDINEIIHIIVYAAAMIIFCILFGKFWVNMAGMDAKSVASQLQRFGLHIPGFRRDPRVVERILQRYIPIITILGSAAVGLLAVLADLTGALGTGTGILLTVGIIYRMYEQLAAEQASEFMPALKKLLG